MSDWIPFEFGRPWCLALGFIAIVWTVWIASRSIAGQSRGWHRFSLTLRVLLLAALSCSLADIRFTWKSDQLTVMFLVDVSASIPTNEIHGKGGILDRVADAASSLPENERAGLIVFGGDAAVVDSPDADIERRPIEAVVDSEATDIAAALRLADATFTHAHAEGARRIVLISDGNATHGDALLEAKNLRVNGAVIDVLPVDYAHTEEILVDAVQVPPEVHPEEPYVVAAIIQAKVPTRARVQLHENEKQVGSQDIDLVVGKNRVEFLLQHAEPARYRYEVRLFPMQGEAGAMDTLSKNNVGHGFTLIRGSSRVLFVGAAEDHGPLLDALQSSRIAVDVTEPTTLPTRPESYFLYDTVILADVPAHELGPEGMKLLHGVVKNLGLGLIMVGGPDAFGAGGYKGTLVEKLLPVEMDIKQRKVLPNGALALILHTCEFARGNMWGKRIAAAAIEILNPKDLVGVLIWGRGGDMWGIPMGPAADKATILATLKNLQPADMPAFSGTMQLGYTGLKKADAQKKHMIIISDGDPQAPSKQLITNFQKNGISISTVCINPHGGRDTGVMKKIAKDTNGRYYFVTDPRKLPQIFVREALQVHRSLIMEETFTPAIQYETEPIRGFAQTGFPQLHGFVLTTAKPLAETPLLSHQGDPILSHWRYGLGKTAAFTSDSGGRWADGWVGWAGYEPFWAQLVRSVARRGGEELFRVERTVDGDRGKIILDAIDAEGHYIDALSIQGRIMNPEFDEQSVDFQQTGPGRYEADFNARQSGTYLASLEYTDGADVKGAAQTGLTVSYSPEFRNLESDFDKLQAIAGTAGGRVVDWSSDFFDHSLELRLNRISMWEPLVWALVFLLFADIFFRRVLLSLAPIRRLQAAMLARRKQREDAGTDQLVGALLKKRDELKQRGARPVIEIKEELDPEDATPASDTQPRPAATKEAPPAESDSFTDRLLKAKKRARGED